MERKELHILVVGGGFAGLATVLHLKDAHVRITLLDKTNHHLFQPLLYQVAMSALSPAAIAYPIRSIVSKMPNVTVILDDALSVDLNNKVVKTTGDDIEYDYLVLAAGARTNYYGHDDWQKYAPGLKTLDDAIEIRRRVLLAFEAAERSTDPEEIRELLTFVVIGGGPTGVELAGSLEELARFVLAQDFRNIKPELAKIVLVEGFDRILPPFPPDLSASAKEQLEALGVQVRTGAMVTDINERGVQLKDDFIPTKTVMWGAGVKAVELTRTLGVEIDRGGRIIVNEDLTIPGHADAFAIGDVANFAHQGEKPLPGVAPVAMQQGAHVAQALRDVVAGRSRKPFHYVDKGSLATIGRNSAVADFGGPHLTGFFAWIAWLFIHILFLIGFRNRLVVLFDWMWSYITYQRGARLITGGHIHAGAEDYEPTAGSKSTKERFQNS